MEITAAARPVRVRPVRILRHPDRKAPVLSPCANVTTYEFGEITSFRWLALIADQRDRPSRRGLPD